MTNLDSILKSGDITAVNGLSSQSYCFFSSHVWMWELYYKESWALKNRCFWTVVLEKSLKIPLDYKIKPVNPKGNQSWISIRRTDAEAETPILWPSNTKKWLIGKDSDAGKDWRQEEKGTTEVEIVGWHHWLDGHEFEQAPGVGDEQGSLVCFSPWGHKESDTTERLSTAQNNNLPLQSFLTIQLSGTKHITIAVQPSPSHTFSSQMPVDCFSEETR